MKAENIQSNTSAPFLAGRTFGTFAQEQTVAITSRLLKDAKAIHTAQDLKDYCQGYKETLTGTGADAQTSMVRKILKVLTASDAKLNEYHKIKTPAAGQKLVKAKMDKGAKGIDSLAKALRIPSAGKAEGDGDSAEPEAETGYVTKADAWWDACIKLGHSDKYGLTTDEMMARIAEIVAK
jgi:hypothetical protein